MSVTDSPKAVARGVLVVAEQRDQSNPPAKGSRIFMFWVLHDSLAS